MSEPELPVIMAVPLHPLNSEVNEHRKMAGKMRTTVILAQIEPQIQSEI
jgi:hypothetical protein